MKRSVFSLLILLWMVIAIVIVFFTGSFSLTGNDIFGINWGSSEGEISIGGGTAIPPTGDIPETPAEEEEDTGGGGGGGAGGGTTVVTDKFSIDKTFLVIKMKKGVSRQEIITITNNRNSNLGINISQENLTNIAFTPEVSFTLSPYEEKKIVINLYAFEDEERNSIIGKINFQSGSLIKSANIILNLEELAPLFDIKTTLLKKIFSQGQTVIADVKVLNFGDLKNIDVNLESSIKDSEENIYDIKKEMFAINDSFTGRVSLKIPYTLPEGKYFFTSKIFYENISADSFESFDVVEKLVNLGVAIFTTIMLVIITIIALITIVLRNKTTGIQTMTTERISKIVPWGDDPNLMK